MRLRLRLPTMGRYSERRKKAGVGLSMEHLHGDVWGGVGDDD